MLLGLLVYFCRMNSEIQKYWTGLAQIAQYISNVAEKRIEKYNWKGQNNIRDAWTQNGRIKSTKYINVHNPV